MGNEIVTTNVRVKQEGVETKTGRLKQLGCQFSLRAGRTKDGWAVRYWFAVYQCDCGNIIVRRCGYGGDSCGCKAVEAFKKHAQHKGATFKVTHGLTKSRTYSSWQKMKQRCSDPKNNQYANYGGRGISVCDRWMSFENFIEDMGHRPEGTSIDRIDANGNYEPNNCRWSDAKSQARNRRNANKITIDGVERTLVEWSELSGTKACTIASRIKKHGYSPREAVFGKRKTNHV